MSSVGCTGLATTLPSSSWVACVLGARWTCLRSWGPQAQIQSGRTVVIYFRIQLPALVND